MGENIRSTRENEENPKIGNWTLMRGENGLAKSKVISGSFEVQSGNIFTWATCVLHLILLFSTFGLIWQDMCNPRGLLPRGLQMSYLYI